MLSGHGSGFGRFRIGGTAASTVDRGACAMRVTLSCMRPRRVIPRDVMRTLPLPPACRERLSLRRIADQTNGCRDEFSVRCSFKPARQHGGVFKTNTEIETCVSRRSRSEEHTSELQSLMRTSYAVFC